MSDALTSRIINGDPAFIHHYPWFCVLTVGCGGSLIHTKRFLHTDHYKGYILTAAHCFYQYKSLIDENNQFDNHIHARAIFGYKSSVYEAQQDYNITAIWLHPQYDPHTIQNDVAVLEIDMASTVPLIFNTNSRLNIDYGNINSILPTIGTPDNIVSEPTIVGFGGTTNDYLLEAHYPKQLQKATGELVDSKFYIKHYNYLPFIYDENIYVGHPSGNPNSAYHGDSGGPLFFKQDNKIYIVGVCSFAEKYSYSDLTPITTPPVVYHSVTQYDAVFQHIFTLSADPWSNISTHLPIMIDKPYQSYIDLTPQQKKYMKLFKIWHTLITTFNYHSQQLTIYRIHNTALHIVYLIWQHGLIGMLKNIVVYMFIFTALYPVFLLLVAIVSVVKMYIQSKHTLGEDQLFYFFMVAQIVLLPIVHQHLYAWICIYIFSNVMLIPLLNVVHKYMLKNPYTSQREFLYSVVASSLQYFHNTFNSYSLQNSRPCGVCNVRQFADLK